MTPPGPLPHHAELTAVVADTTMNRERRPTGTNGCPRDLGVDPVDRLLPRAPDARRLGLCSGEVPALREARAGCRRPHG
ncbi:hypothetical protein PV392_04650 [Streptomyces sp. ME03-5709C]|nr:hypothetical protein [Streptomyces sp. ME03-5709C]